MNGLSFIVLLFSGFELIGAATCLVAIIVRVRSKREDAESGSQTEIDAALTLLLASLVLPIVGLIIQNRTHRQEWELLPIAGLFMTAPIGAILAFRGQGVNRKVILAGYGALILWTVLSALIAFV